MSAKTNLQAWCRAASERMNLRNRGALLAHLVDKADGVFANRPDVPIHTHFTGPVAVRRKP